MAAGVNKKQVKAQGDFVNGQLQGTTNELDYRNQPFADFMAPALQQYQDRTNAMTPEASGITDYSNMVKDQYAHPGYSDAEQAGMRNATGAPIASSFAAAQAAAKRSGVMTGTPTGTAGASSGDFARQRAQMMSTALGGLQKSFGDARIQGQQFATQAQAQVPQMNQNYLAQFQYPMNFAQGQYNQNMSNKISNTGQGIQQYGQMGQLAAQPGLLKKMLVAGAQGTGQAATTALLS